MTQIGTETHPLRVAIIGAGPSGFYVAEHLLQQQQYVVEVDMLERLPTPYGLVRGGVAPDHQKIKAVTATYDKIAAHPRFRFYGYVEFGTLVTLDDLRTFYHQVVFTTGAQTDQHMGIPGEDLQGSHPATAFVAWYNGHPDFRAQQFDFSCERAAVVGVGNVAVDVARILCRTPEELARTDIADYALEALCHSRIKEVYMLGRRGPAQAAFTNPELKELGELAGADVFVPPAEAELDELSLQALDEKHDRGTVRKIEMLQAYSQRQPTGKPRRLTIRFLVSPVELVGNAAGQVSAIRLVKNKLYATEAGTLRPQPTGEYEELPVGLVFRSVGYRGVPLPGLPFDERWGVLLNQKGRVFDPSTSQPLSGIYTAGWIKRGPTGVIGTNKPDALETVKCMLEDVQNGSTLQPISPDPMAVEKWLRECQPAYVSYADWLRLNALEVAQGKALGRPRLKYTSVEEMLTALQKDPTAVPALENSTRRPGMNEQPWGRTGVSGTAYDARFAALEHAGRDMHGEANFVAALGVTSVLDAGCGTGRVAIELSRRGYTMVGVDRDPEFLRMARQKAPQLTWYLADLATVELTTADTPPRLCLFDAIVMAGNVMIFLDPGTEAAVIANLARHLAPGGFLIAGFQLQPGAISLPHYDAYATDAGLNLFQRWATWERQPWHPASDYAVSVHRRAPGV